MYFKLAWRNIWRNKRRTFITAGSIMFAVFFASLMRSTQYGVFNRMIENSVRFYSGYLQIHEKGYWEDKSINQLFDYTPALQKLTDSSPHITAHVPRLESFAMAAGKSITRGVMVVGTDPSAEDALTKLQSKLIAGSYLKPNDKAILIAEGAAKYLKIGVGDTLVMISQGYHGANAAGKYPIKGIVKFPMPDLNKQLVYLPLKEAQWFYAADNKLSSIALVLDKAENTPLLAAQLQKQLDPNAYEIMDWKTMMPELVQQIDLDVNSGHIILGILYAIIGFGIFGTILMMMAERRYEFGILLSIGMKRFTLAFTVLIEIILLGLLGALMGIAISWPITYYFQENPISLAGDMGEVYESFGIEPIIPLSADITIFLTQAVMVLIMTLVIAIYPLWTIRSLNPIQAMRA